MITRQDQEGHSGCRNQCRSDGSGCATGCEWSDSCGALYGEYWAMGETLTQQRRVKEEGFRVVNFFYQGRRT